MSKISSKQIPRFSNMPPHDDDRPISPQKFQDLFDARKALDKASSVFAKKLLGASLSLHLSSIHIVSGVEMRIFKIKCMCACVCCAFVYVCLRVEYLELVLDLFRMLNQF